MNLSTITEQLSAISELGWLALLSALALLIWWLIGLQKAAAEKGNGRVKVELGGHEIVDISVSKSTNSDTLEPIQSAKELDAIINQGDREK